MPAIKAHNTATTDGPWNQAAQAAKLKSPITGAEAVLFYAWYDQSGSDPDGDGWPDYKNSYKFGHHVVGDSGLGGAANMAACSGGIAVLNGARGGHDLSTTDRQGVYDHLARHLGAGGKKPPPLGASAEDSEAFAAEVEAEVENALLAAQADTTQALSRHAGADIASGEGDEPQIPLLPALGASAWAMREDALPQLLEAHQAALADPQMAKAIASAVPQAATRKLGMQEKRSNGGVAVIPLCGVITPSASFLSMLFGGGGGLEAFRASFMEALSAPEVGSIVLDVDSPGGMVSLVPETAAMIRAARGKKPIIAVCNTTAASAAYWLAAQCDEVVCTPSGQAGSIGVYMIHEDLSGALDQRGISVTYIKAGKHKAEGNRTEPLSDDAKAFRQQEVDDLYGMFVDDVATGRGASAADVRSGYGEGRCLLAARALEAGLCDRVATLDAVVGELLGVPASPDDPSNARGEQDDGARADDDEQDDDETPPEDEPGDDEDDEQEEPETDARQLSEQERRAAILFS